LIALPPLLKIHVSARMLPPPRLLALALALAAAGSAAAQGGADFEQPPVSYSNTTPRDAVTRLQAKIAAGELKVPDREQDALRTLLAELHVPVASQLLVFSKTSLQRGRIRPDQPRALYFSDTVYVGWVPGGLAEIAAIDPQLGPVFYAVDLPASQHGAPPIARDSDCLRCHGGNFVRDVPGVFARSVFADAHGDPLLRHGTLVVDDETPFEQRWGGWYVTGYHGTEPHRGNVIASEAGDQLVFAAAPQRPDELSGFFDPSPYLAATSDVAALLVVEHQMGMQNSLTRANHAARKMLAYQHGLQTSFKEPVTDEPTYDSVKSVFASTVQDVVDHLLFRNAAVLPAGVTGGPAFRASFPKDVPRDAAGRSLKDLRLQERIFAQRCSYLIYSPSFRELPDSIKLRILDRLGEVLRNRDPKDRYAYLPADEKQRIYEILRETHPDAKARWAASAVAKSP
jgi:hypothetical protein